jgi:hypothetical protein
MVESPKCSDAVVVLGSTRTLRGVLSLTPACCRSKAWGVVGAGAGLAEEGNEVDGRLCSEDADGDCGDEDEAHGGELGKKL